MFDKKKEKKLTKNEQNDQKWKKKKMRNRCRGERKDAMMND